MTLKAKQLSKRAIVSLSEAAEIGYIDNIVFDREARMAALIFKRRHAKRELATTTTENVCAMGKDAVTIVSSDEVRGNDKVEELGSWPNVRQLLGCRVITEGGVYLGTIRDVVLDPEERRITAFELVGRGVWGRIRGDRLPATGHLRFGTELLIVPNAVTLKGRAVLRPIEQPGGILEQSVTQEVAPTVVLSPTSIRGVAADEPSAAPRDLDAPGGDEPATNGAREDGLSRAA